MCLKFQLFHTLFAKILLTMCLFHKILGGTADSVDPDQQQSDLGLFCLHIPGCYKNGVQNFKL